MTVAGTKQKVRRLSMTDERLKIVKYINDPVIWRNRYHTA